MHKEEMWTRLVQCNEDTFILMKTAYSGHFERKGPEPNNRNQNID